ncbi:hypothetical protein HZB93_01460 [Candidatus Falkowbacteria bacterium]|nr:hypothetical protein [Candidatus Falkowbacteria bacterium]
MKKQIIFSLILVGGLILLGAGCAAPRETKTNTNANVNEITNEAAKPAGVEPGVTEEELNKLKADINEMNYEDLNALTK